MNLRPKRGWYMFIVLADQTITFTGGSPPQQVRKGQVIDVKSDGEWYPRLMKHPWFLLYCPS